MLVVLLVVILLVAGMSAVRHVIGGRHGLTSVHSGGYDGGFVPDMSRRICRICAGGGR